MNRMMLVAACGAAAFVAFGCGTDGEDEPPFEPTALELRADRTDFEVGTPVQLQAVGIDAEGVEQVLTEGVVFASSNEQLATVDASGLVTVVKGGDVSFTAQAGSLQAQLGARTSCVYPKFSPELKFNRVIPALEWPARWPDGTDFDFRLADVHCDLDWAQTKTLTFVISAGWCVPCTKYAQMLETQVNELKNLGMQIVIVEAQDTEGLPADLDFAYEHLDRITNTIPGIAVGDADTRPEATFLGKSSIVRAFPTVFVVRTSDMRIIADQNRGNTYLPLADIAANPDADWSNPSAPTFENECTGPDEAGEPNDVWESATVIGPGTHAGGICTDAPDFYKVELEGTWTVQLAFEQSVGDLDVFVWDTARNREATKDGQILGSATDKSPETFTHTGPAVISVQGFQHGSASYTLTLTEN